MTRASVAGVLAKAPFGVTLSSGFFGFYAHLGVIAALEEAQLRPSHVTGASSGALVAGLWGAGMSASVLQDLFFDLDRSAFWDPAPGLGLLRGARMTAELSRRLPVQRFEEAPVKIGLSAFAVRRRRTVVLDRGDLASAIMASCAYPVLFQPVFRDGVSYLDGGIADRAGLAGMPVDLPVVYHHLPHSSPWRRHGSQASLPARRQLVVVHTPDLPRVHPFALARGRAAYDAALETTRACLQADYASRP